MRYPRIVRPTCRHLGCSTSGIAVPSPHTFSFQSLRNDRPLKKGFWVNSLLHGLHKKRSKIGNSRTETGGKRSRAVAAVPSSVTNFPYSWGLTLSISSFVQKHWGGLKQVSTLPSDALIRRTDTTTFHHVLAILWYQMKHELLLNKIESLLWRNMSPWQRASPAKTPLILSLSSCLYLKKDFSDLHIFYFWKVIRRQG